MQTDHRNYGVRIWNSSILDPNTTWLKILFLYIWYWSKSTDFRWDLPPTMGGLDPNSIARLGRLTIHDGCFGHIQPYPFSFQDSFRTPKIHCFFVGFLGAACFFSTGTTSNLWIKKSPTKSNHSKKNPFPNVFFISAELINNIIIA